MLWYWASFHYCRWPNIVRYFIHLITLILNCKERMKKVHESGKSLFKLFHKYLQILSARRRMEIIKGRGQKRKNLISWICDQSCKTVSANFTSSPIPLNMDQTRPLVYFQLLLNRMANIEQILTIIGRSVNSMLWIRTRDRRLVGVDESTQL